MSLIWPRPPKGNAGLRDLAAMVLSLWMCSGRTMPATVRSPILNATRHRLGEPLRTGIVLPGDICGDAERSAV
jgi:hypothetical protein